MTKFEHGKETNYPVNFLYTMYLAYSLLISCPFIWRNLKEMVCLEQSSSTLPNMKEADVLYCELHRVYVNMFIDAYILK